jgi:hypothetical protein
MQGIGVYLDVSAKSSIGGWLSLFNSFMSGLWYVLALLTNWHLLLS